MFGSAAEMFDRATQLADSARLQEALSQYEALFPQLEEVDDKVTVLIQQIYCLNHLGRAEEARRRLRTATELLPSGSENRPHLDYAEADILAAEGKREDALRLLDRIIANRASLIKTQHSEELYREIQQRRAVLLIELGRDKDARPILEEVLTFGVGHVSVPFYAGVCYFGLAEYDLAKKHYEDALRKGLPPVWEWQARVHLGPIYYAEGALAKAKLQYERAEVLGSEIGAQPHDTRNVYLWLAKICRELGEADEAERYQQLASQIPAAPANP